MQASDSTASAVSAGRKPRDDEIDVYGLTHPGKVRRENQDHFLISSLQKWMQVHLTSLPTSDLLSPHAERQDRKSTRLNSSHLVISYAVFCLKKKNKLASIRVIVVLGIRPGSL